MDNTALQPRLPLDIERLIFEQAAREDHRSCLCLMFVARRTHEWIRPILYESIELVETGDAKMSYLLRTLFHAPRLRNQIKRLRLRSAIQPHQCSLFLSILPALVHLELWDHKLLEDDAIALIIGSQIKRLSVLCKDQTVVQSLFDSVSNAPECPLTKSLTHLIVDNHGVMSTPLEHFVALSHVAFLVDVKLSLDSFRSSVATVLDLLKRPSLSVVVFLVRERCGATIQALRILREHGAFDNRVVMLGFECLKPWDTFVQRGSDMWTEAEGMIKEIQGQQ